MKFFKIFILMFTVFYACSKQEEFAKNDSTNVTTREDNYRKKYVKQACIVNNCAGIRCAPAATPSGCNKSRPCEAIPGGCLTDYSTIINNLNTYSTQHANAMLQDESICEEDWQATNNLCRDLLIERANNYQ